MTTTVDRPNRAALNQAIDIYRDAMRPFIIRNLRRVPRQRVEDVICHSLNDAQASRFRSNLAQTPGNIEAAIDVGDFPDLISRNWRSVFSRQFPSGDRVVQDLSRVIREARNKAAHPDTDDLDIEFVRVRLHDIMDVMDSINAPEQRQEVNEILRRLLLDPMDHMEEVTHFFRKVQKLTSDELSEHIRLDRSSRRGGYANRNPNSFYYELWYSSGQQWGSARMRYRLELNRKDDSVSSWSANVGFRYNKNGLEKMGYSEEHFNILENVVQASEAHTDLGNFTGGRRPKAMVRFDDESTLSDHFAHSLSNTLRILIEEITPIVNEFENERTNQESVQ